MSAAKKTRKHRTYADKCAFLDEWKRLSMSGITKVDFSRARGITISAFEKWCEQEERIKSIGHDERMRVVAKGLKRKKRCNKRPSDAKEAELYDWVQGAPQPIDQNAMRIKALQLWPEYRDETHAKCKTPNNFRKYCLRFATRFSPQTETSVSPLRDDDHGSTDDRRAAHHDHESASDRRAAHNDNDTTDDLRAAHHAHNYTTDHCAVHHAHDSTTEHRATHHDHDYTTEYCATHHDHDYTTERHAAHNDHASNDDHHTAHNDNDYTADRHTYNHSFLSATSYPSGASISMMSDDERDVIEVLCSQVQHKDEQEFVPADMDEVAKLYTHVDECPPIVAFHRGRLPARLARGSHGKRYNTGVHSTSCSTCNWRSPCNSFNNCMNVQTYTECTRGICSAQEYCLNNTIQQRRYPNTTVVVDQKFGYGLRLDEDVAQDTKIVEYVGQRISKDEYVRRKMTLTDGSYLAQLALGSDLYVDAREVGNFSRFINHSCRPNCNFETWYVHKLPRLFVVARTALVKGTILSAYYMDPSWGVQCLCGACEGQFFPPPAGTGNYH
ncbi:Aste57867_958 [Aphanomyces stellatus]|uniref:Aste57867_958 protein n=1 Tax=Aphanomyces stellatus TaxID=120398 RepID=A0A485K6M0_9STRA|nr:hypothetical protein As57867_000957 [Aphanomyces stellatus]VFT78180.1 Aste57867_958 [Aphanomyces stellatus]